jgi:hypothetical protein
MAKQGRSSNSKKRTSQSTSFGISPDEVLDTVDTGDETQLRFRYQHAYGVTLLLASRSFRVVDGINISSKKRTFLKTSY